MRILFYLPLAAVLLCGFVVDTPKKGKIEFVYKGSDAQILQGIKKAQQVIDDRDNVFFEGIRDKDKFGFTIEKPSTIADYLYEANLKVRVRGYEGGDDTKTLAYVTSEYPTTVFINTSKQNRKTTSIANTLIHELIHVLDRSVPEAKFGHGGNSASGKGNSAPYWIGDWAAKVLNNETVASNFLRASNNGEKRRLVNSFQVVALDEDSSIEETENIDDSHIKD